MAEADEEACCPLCLNELDETDEAVEFCHCGYAMCLWCWHRICGEAAKEGAAARCPNCRTIYDLDAIHQRSVSRLEEVKKRKALQLERKKSSLPGVKGRKDLANMRVVQRNLVYVVGLSMDLCYEDVLQSAEHFGQFGKVVKISVSRAGPYGAASAKNKPTGSAYITFRRNEDARRCIETMHNTQWDGKVIKACYGTTKYCNAFLKGVACSNSDCLYLHDVADDEDSYTKEETKSTKFVNLVHAASLSRQASGPPPAAAAAPAAGASGAAGAAAVRAVPVPETSGAGAYAGTPRAPAMALERAAAASAPTALTDDQVGTSSQGNGHAWPALGGASWAAKATVGAAATAPAHGVAPPPAANAQEWPQLPGASGDAGEGADIRPAPPVPPLARSGSTMAAQLARATSVPNGGPPGSARGAQGGVLVVAKGKKLMPLSPAGKARVAPAAKPALTPLGPGQ
ncbi:hypothetical protein WJX81_005640 [Elliptochloris bilobata]|uniref:CCR4-NOT transcription complex subunit 4 n=1 Tax=Elliptochloris bilobata TaxID=381761 RepID=A0AAW1QID7_9CHLO